MMKKAKNTDFLFVVTLSLGLLLHIFFLFIIPYFHDETHYATVPFRLINGDSLIQHEWHLTQFASLFSYLPVYIWTAIKGSTDSIFIFLRCTYLLIHTTLAVAIYRFFRKYGKWAIMASMIFYIQITYRIQAISYQSMFVVFLLLLSLCLISVYEKKSTHFYIFAGICFGCCCVCNPLFCFGFALYLLTCLLWTKRQVLKEKLLAKKFSDTSKKEKKLTKRQKKQQEQQFNEIFPDMESYNCFFCKEAILRISLGILIVAVTAASFFLLTGGTISSLFGNLENLLGSSEYDFVSFSIFSKYIQTIEYFSAANLGMPWLLPAMFIILLFDKNRRNNAHRFAYLTFSVVWSILFMVVILLIAEFKLFAISLPFCVFSTLCYILTGNKNKPLFYCMYIPCLIASFFQYLAADTHLAAIGVVLAVNNVAGVFFAMDLWKEIRLAPKEESEATDSERITQWCYRIITISFCLQILFYGIFYMYGQVPIKNPVRATDGPYSGLYMSEEQYDSYTKSMDDLDYIKTLSKADDPVLIATYENWMYLYVERPIATYTTWYRGSLDSKQLTQYHKENPKKIPKYIYIESSDPQGTMAQFGMEVANEMFYFTSEELSHGVLLTVNGRKY